MVKVFLPLFLLCALLPGRLGASAPATSGSPSSVAAQDVDGTVWALPPDSRFGQICRWQSGRWAEQAVPDAAGLRLWVLARGDDGSVYGFWQGPATGQDRTPQCLVTVQRGGTSRSLARFSGTLATDQGYYCVPTIYAGVAGDVWLAGRQPLLWHIFPNGTVKTFPLMPKQFFGGKLPAGPPPSLASFVDGDGRRWFWQNPQYLVNASTLRGFLVWDGSKLGYYPTLPGLPDHSYSVAAPLDAAHFWLAVTFFGRSNQSSANSPGLYRIDTRTFCAVPELPPQHSAFDRILEVFQVGGDTYVKEQDNRTLKLFFWRRRAGQWKTCLIGLDGNNWGTLNPWLSEPSGLWIGARGGAWWLPRGNKNDKNSGPLPVWVNWRRGLAALNITGLFSLPSGRILASGDQQTAEMPPTPQPLRSLPPGVTEDGMNAPEGLDSLVADPRHHLWGIRRHYRADAPLALAEWDGTRWRLHIPPAIPADPYDLYACDSLGRLWLNTSVWHPPVQPQPVYSYAVYDPAHEVWTSYATVPDALQAAAALPKMAFLGPDFFRGAPVFYPAFSGDGRVAYADNSAGNPRGMILKLYDGKVWRQWQTQDISPGAAYGDYGQLPHFRSDGHLEIVLGRQVWDWVPKDGWQKSAEPPPASVGPLLPPGGPPGLSDVPVPDGTGASWFTWQNSVYTTRKGLWVKQAALSSFGSPFQQGMQIESTLRDPAGRLFFVTRPGGVFDLIVWSPPPVPKPKLAVTPVSEDSVSVRFSSALDGPHWFLWRVNGGAWSAPTTAKMLALSALPRGDYRLEVMALDSRLQVSPAAVAVWSVRVTPETQIARWVSALSAGPDEAREIAVAGLLKQPAAALPALKAARPAASELGKWWIDAAIQQITAGETPQIAN